MKTGGGDLCYTQGTPLLFFDYSNLSNQKNQTPSQIDNLQF
jgi:hypothetical protein